MGSRQSFITGQYPRIASQLSSAEATQFASALNLNGLVAYVSRLGLAWIHHEQESRLKAASLRHFFREPFWLRIAWRSAPHIWRVVPIPGRRLFRSASFRGGRLFEIPDTGLRLFRSIPLRGGRLFGVPDSRLGLFRPLAIRGWRVFEPIAPRGHTLFRHVAISGTVRLRRPRTSGGAISLVGFPPQRLPTARAACRHPPGSGAARIE